VIQHPVLQQLAQHGVRLGLDRMASFLDFLGEPHRAYSVIHVAGTNGKGSICTFIEQGLICAGYRVGTTTSPHIEHLNERVRIDGVSISDALLTEEIEALNRARLEWASAMQFRENPLTYFEFMTCLAFRVFASAGVDVAVVEVGLGGRLDATNVVAPLVTAIGHVGLDHMTELGESLAEIAGEKAGIMKRGVPVVIGPLAPEARTVIEERAKALRAPLWKPGAHLTRAQGRRGWSFGSPEGSLRDVSLKMLGAHQGANASVALGVLHVLRRQGFALEDGALHRGLEQTKLAGRIETIRPGLVVDGAHNPDGTRALAAWLGTLKRPTSRILLWGMNEGRDPCLAIEPLLEHVDEVVTTRSLHPKAMDPEELASELSELDVTLSVGGALEEILPEIFVEAEQTLVAGSLFVVGAVRSVVQQGLLDGLAPSGASSESEFNL
jgi:dihydrofolate synthase/folylpolyglutamate synthase